MQQDSRSRPDPNDSAPGAGAASAEGAGALPDDANAGAAAAPGVRAELERQLTEQKDKYLRLAAEFDNYRKRVQRERQEIVARAQGDLVRQLADSLDDLTRVTAVNPDGVDARSIVQGVDAIRTKLMRTLTAAGLEVVDPVDQPFNPELHEAVSTERALSPEDDHLVSQVYQPGYVFQGQLLRPARVVVKQWAE